MKNILFYFVAALFILSFQSCAKKDSVDASGTIEVKNVDVASKLSGRITKLYVNEGDNVRKDQLLAEIDDRLVNAQYEDAKAVYSQAYEDYKRAKGLYKESKSISKQSYDQAETFYIQAKSRLEQAEVMKEEAEVKAPWSGVILEKYVEEGELISSMVPLFNLGDLKTAELMIYIPLIELELIKLGDTATVKIDAYKDKIFTGKIVYISDKAEFTPKNIQTKDERVKEVFAVKILIDNKEGIFKPGMPADAIMNINM